MSGHQVDQSGRIKAAQRHVATLALLNGVSCVVFGGVAAWLFTGVPFAVDQDEARARICLGAFSAIACVLNAVLAMGLRRCNRVARVGQTFAAVLALPLVPFGPVWGTYALWCLWHREGRSLFVHEDGVVTKRLGQPYAAAAMPAVALGVALLTFGLLKSQEFWLTRKVRAAASHAALRQSAIDQSMQRLRDLSVEDLAEERLRGRRSDETEVVAPAGVPDGG